MRSMDQIDMNTSDLFDSGTRVNPLHESNLVDQDSTAYFANCASETIAWNNVISTLATRTQTRLGGKYQCTQRIFSEGRMFHRKLLN